MIIGCMTDTAALPDAATVPIGMVRLPEWGLIRARGEDAASFLQGQLTNDLLSLDRQHACLAGYCSAKGRLQASFVVWRASDHEWLLACSADLLPTILKRLSMFVLRAKCKLDDAGADLTLWGAVGALPPIWSPADMPNQPYTLSRQGDWQALRLTDAQGLARWLVVGPAAALPVGAADLSLATWRWLEVASAVPRIVAATADAFVPQMVNFELVGGVSFKKGCYPGQEVVARSQYRGTLKRRAVLLVGKEPMQPGQEVFHSADPGQPAGTVALSAPGPDGQHWALVELKLAALDAGNLSLASPHGTPLQTCPLPYNWPQDEN